MTKIAGTDLDVFPLCLGGNVFGRTADERRSFEVLDAYAEAGGNFIDTADLYAGGESERIIGRWLRRRGRRDDIVIATKVGMAQPLNNLRPETIRTGVEASLRRLDVDHIDLYYAHRDDLNTPVEESLEVFDALVREGKVRHIGASNFSAARLARALAVPGMTRYTVLQPHYNLLVRKEYEAELADLCVRENIAVAPYFALAKGFLTGKYRPGGPAVESTRAAAAGAYLDDRGIATLGVLTEVAAAHGTTVAAVALAWLRDRPGVVAPIASAREAGQLADLLPMVDLRLTDDEISRLSDASAE